MPRAAYLVRALRLGPRTWADLGRAAIELGRARWRLFRHPSQEHVRNGRLAVTGPVSGRLAADRVERVAFAVPRVAARLPWRADCLVQAMAAQAWLARSGIPADIHLGVRKDRAPGFEAHAWLVADGRIVTGGDIDGFIPLLTPESDLRVPKKTASSWRPGTEADELRQTLR